MLLWLISRGSSKVYNEPCRKSCTESSFEIVRNVTEVFPQISNKMVQHMEKKKCYFSDENPRPS